MIGYKHKESGETVEAMQFDGTIPSAKALMSEVDRRQPDDVQLELKGGRLVASGQGENLIINKGWYFTFNENWLLIWQEKDFERTYEEAQ